MDLTKNSLWEIIIFDNGYIFDHKFIMDNICSLKKYLNISAQYFYSVREPCMDLPEEFIFCRISAGGLEKLVVAIQFMTNKKNIIIVDTTIQFTGRNGLQKFLDNNTNIYCKFVDVNYSTENIYANLSKKFGFNKIITSEIMVIPQNKNNLVFLNNVLSMAEKLHTPNVNDAINIALSVQNTKFADVKNISMNDILGHVFFALETKILPPEIPTLIIPYDHQDYLYHPYLSINLNMGKLNQQKELPQILNTDGYFTDNMINPKSFFFKKYGNKMSGIFVKKNDVFSPKIPKIINHMWIDIEPAVGYINAWKKMLRLPWQYVVWTEKDIIMLDNKWSRLFMQQILYEMKLLIAFLAVLDVNGGFAIDSFSIPLKLVPDELLINNFFVSYLDEKNYGTKISYRIIASIPNNPMFDNIYKVLNLPLGSEPPACSQNINLIDQIIISNLDAMIYPSYYFNPGLSGAPKKVLLLTICINLWKMEYREERIKTVPVRNYRTNINGIITKLNENPRHKLLNT